MSLSDKYGAGLYDTDRKTDRHTDRQTERQIDRQQSPEGTSYSEDWDTR